MQGIQDNINWFGSISTLTAIGERYDMHRTTIRKYFVKEQHSASPCLGILTRIIGAKSPKYNRNYKRPSGSMIDVSGLGPRVNLSSIPSATSYERRLWGQ